MIAVTIAGRCRQGKEALEPAHNSFSIIANDSQLQGRTQKLPSYGIVL
jgi:hypothetical protein